MTDKEIVSLLRADLLRACGRGKYGLIHHFLRDPIPFDTPRTNRVRAWFQSLSKEQRAQAIELMDECADMCLFTLATALDGAHMLAEKLWLELYVNDEGGRRLLTSGGPDYKGEYMHDTVAEVLKEPT